MQSAGMVVQVCPPYVDLERETGGVSNVVRQISLRLARMGKPVHVICGNRELGRIVSSPKQDLHGPSLRRTVLGQNPHPLLGPVGRLGAILEALPLNCVVHVHTCFSAFTEYAMAVLKRRGIPYVFTPHGKLTGVMMERHSILKKVWWSWCIRDHVNAASSITLLSRQEGVDLRQLGVVKSPYIIPNGYERHDSHSAPLIEGRYILFLGYIDPRKRPEFLVRAFAASRARASSKLVFAGPDAYGFRQVVERVIQECGVEDRVIWYGPAYGAAKWNLLNHAACLGLPSKAEGLPVVMCEALGAGLPSIYSSGCNFPEVQERAAGVQLEEADEERWARAIDEVVLNEPARRCMQQAATEMGQDYAWESIVARWCRHYDALASGIAPK